MVTRRGVEFWRLLRGREACQERTVPSSLPAAWRSDEIDNEFTQSRITRTRELAIVSLKLKHLQHDRLARFDHNRDAIIVIKLS